LTSRVHTAHSTHPHNLFAQGYKAEYVLTHSWLTFAFCGSKVGSVWKADKQIFLLKLYRSYGLKRGKHLGLISAPSPRPTQGTKVNVINVYLMKWSYQVDFINLHTGVAADKGPKNSREPVKTGAGVMKVLLGIRWESFSLLMKKSGGNELSKCTEKKVWSSRSISLKSNFSFIVQY